MQHKSFPSRPEDDYVYNQGSTTESTFGALPNVYWPYTQPISQSNIPSSADYHPSLPDNYPFRSAAHPPFPESSCHLPQIPAASDWNGMMEGSSSSAPTPHRHHYDHPHASHHDPPRQFFEGPSLSPSQPVASDSQQGSQHQAVHEWAEAKNMTLPKDIERFVITKVDRCGKKYYCGCMGCTHFNGFVRKAQCLTHIRSVHLCEKPFICMACDATFTRRQDAVRHVETMNSGKQYKCHYCDEGFARKDYRDRHSDRCKFR